MDEQYETDKAELMANLFKFSELYALSYDEKLLIGRLLEELEGE